MRDCIVYDIKSRLLSDNNYFIYYPMSENTFIHFCANLCVRIHLYAYSVLYIEYIHRNANYIIMLMFRNEMENWNEYNKNTNETTIT